VYIFVYQLLQRLKREPLLDSLDVGGVAAFIKSGRAKRIIVMCGAGVSVSAGIPDFRTPGTGLYSQLERFGLPEPEAVFSISFFKKNPKPFHMLAKELFPGKAGLWCYWGFCWKEGVMCVCLFFGGGMMRGWSVVLCGCVIRWDWCRNKSRRQLKQHVCGWGSLESSRVGNL